MNTEPNRLFNI